LRLPALAVAFVLGVLLGPKLGSSPAALALFLLAAALTVPLALSLRWRTVPVFMLLALAAGMLRAGTVEPEPAAALAQFHRASDLQVEGVVLDEPEDRSTDFVWKWSGSVATPGFGSREQSW